MKLSNSNIRFNSIARMCIRVCQSIRAEFDARDYLISAIESFHSQLIINRSQCHHNQILFTNGVILADLVLQGSRRTKQQSVLVLFNNEYDFEIPSEARLMRDGYTLKFVFLHFFNEYV